MALKVSIAPLLALLAAGCAGTVTRGQGDGGTSAGSPTSGASAGASTTTGAAAASSGNVSGGQTSTGGSTGGTSSGAGTAGSTSGGCLDLALKCYSNDECCSGGCEQICRKTIGEACLLGTDCTSFNCDGGVCACASPQAGQVTHCALDADCCNGVSCTLTDLIGQQYGICCSPVGGLCQSGADCCDGDCDGGSCQCLALGDPLCAKDGDCCSGKCIVVPNNPAESLCKADPGDPCSRDVDCQTGACVDGGCDVCSVPGSLCDPPDLSCCGAAACAQNVAGGSMTCCVPNGSACGGDPDCCSQSCVDGGCACAGATEACANEQGCCAGQTCLPLASTGSDMFACCVDNGNFCVADDECCAGFCGNGACGCAPSGTPCASIGSSACCTGQCADGGACL